MSGKHCRLYDENLVQNIMISTGLSVLEFLKKNKAATSDDICEFVEINAPSIIEDTIEHLNSIDGFNERPNGEEDQDWGDFSGRDRGEI